MSWTVTRFLDNNATAVICIDLGIWRTKSPRMSLVPMRTAQSKKNHGTASYGDMAGGADRGIQHIQVAKHCHSFLSVKCCSCWELKKHHHENPRGEDGGRRGAEEGKKWPGWGMGSGDGAQHPVLVAVPLPAPSPTLLLLLKLVLQTFICTQQSVFPACSNTSGFTQGWRGPS